MEWQFILLLKILVGNKVFFNVGNSELNHNYVKYKTELEDINANGQIVFVHFPFCWSQ
jgi:hypothetical protein